MSTFRRTEKFLPRFRHLEKGAWVSCLHIAKGTTTDPSVEISSQSNYLKIQTSYNKMIQSFDKNIANCLCSQAVVKLPSNLTSYCQVVSTSPLSTLSLFKSLECQHQRERQHQHQVLSWHLQQPESHQSTERRLVSLKRIQ